MQMKYTIYYPLADENAHPDPSNMMIVPVAYFTKEHSGGVFESMQSMEEAWVRSRDYGIIIGLRSACAGDIIENEETGKWYRFEGFGFAEVDKSDYQVMRFAMGPTEISGDPTINPFN